MLINIHLLIVSDHWQLALWLRP